jgi:hypothetical protein
LFFIAIEKYDMRNFYKQHARLFAIYTCFSAAAASNFGSKIVAVAMDANKSGDGNSIPFGSIKFNQKECVR